MKFLGVILFTITSLAATAQIQINRPIQLTGSGSDAKVEGIKDVSNPQDAANKAYVDSVSASLLDSIDADAGSGGPSWNSYAPTTVIGTYNTSFNGQRTYNPTVVDAGYILDGKMVHYKVTFNVSNPACCGNQNYQLLYIDIDLPLPMANVLHFIPTGVYDKHLSGNTPTSPDIVHVSPLNTGNIRITYGNGDVSLYRWPNNQAGNVELSIGFTYMAQ